MCIKESHRSLLHVQDWLKLQYNIIFVKWRSKGRERERQRERGIEKREKESEREGKSSCTAHSNGKCQSFLLIHIQCLSLPCMLSMRRKICSNLVVLRIWRRMNVERGVFNFVYAFQRKLWDDSICRFSVSA